MEFLNKLHTDKHSAGKTVEANKQNLISSNPYPKLGKLLHFHSETKVTAVRLALFVHLFHPHTVKLNSQKCQFSLSSIPEFVFLVLLQPFLKWSNIFCAHYWLRHQVCTGFSSSDHPIKSHQAWSWALAYYKTALPELEVLRNKQGKEV